ncbi:MAG: hypothetical protein ACR2FQ_11640 [Pseudonocardiaceae bacterium]
MQDRALVHDAGVVELGFEVDRLGFGHGRQEGLASGAVAAPEWARPDERAGVGLAEFPPAAVLDVVVVATDRAEVGADGDAAEAVVVGVVLFGGVAGRRQPMNVQVRSRIWVCRRSAAPGSRASGWESRSW